MIWALATLTLKIVNQSVYMTLQLMRMHQNTKFTIKMFGSFENIIWINSDILTLHCDLDLECSNPIFPQDTLAYDDVSSDQVWLPKDEQFRRHKKESYFDHMT